MQAKDACTLSQANVVLWGCHRTWLRLCRCAVIAVGTILEIEPHNCQILKRVAAEAEVDPDANKMGEPRSVQGTRSSTQLEMRTHPLCHLASRRQIAAWALLLVLMVIDRLTGTI